MEEEKRAKFTSPVGGNGAPGKRQRALRESLKEPARALWWPHILVMVMMAICVCVYTRLDRRGSSRKRRKRVVTALYKKREQHHCWRLWGRHGTSSGPMLYRFYLVFFFLFLFLIYFYFTWLFLFWFLVFFARIKRERAVFNADANS